MNGHDPLGLSDSHGQPHHLTANERRTRWVVLITLVVMVVELAAGQWTGSLALTADGWHMATHAGALGLSLVAYWFARTRARSQAFTFGTGKVYALAGFSSAVLLAVAALWMFGEAAVRLWTPSPVRFSEALWVAVFGLGVNLLSIRVLHGGPGHDHDHDHDHAHDHDQNLRAVYLHVLADALTSVFAIVALLCGQYLGWAILDPIMGVVGGALIVRWSVGLGRDAALQLLDASADVAARDRIRKALEALDDVRVIDLHLWWLGPGRRACVTSLVTRSPRAIAEYRRAVLQVESISHLTVEVHGCGDQASDLFVGCH